MIDVDAVIHSGQTDEKHDDVKKFANFDRQYHFRRPGLAPVWRCRHVKRHRRHCRRRQAQRR